MIYVILGMHKSGTTLVSSLLHHAGINMIEDENKQDYDKGGYYEREATLQLNYDILGLEDDMILFVEPPQNLTLSDAQREKMDSIISDLSGRYDDWGFKDPRTCLNYELWRERLPEHRIITVYRPVGELWQRYRYSPLPWKNFPRMVALTTRWCEYNTGVINAVKQMPSENTLILDYHALMQSDEEYKRLEDFVGRPLEDTRRKDLFRHKGEDTVLLGFAKQTAKQKNGFDYQQIYDQLAELRQQQLTG